MNQEIKIAIADDHQMIIDGVRSMIQHYSGIQLVGTYKNGSSLLAGLEQQMVDVLLLDIQMPDTTGDELAPKLLSKYPQLKILVLTNFDSALYAKNMFKRGVHGYLVKAAESEILAHAVKVVYDGGEFVEEEMKEKIRNMNVMERNVSFSKTSLTPRELKVLQLLVDGKTAQQIAKEEFLSFRTVVNYRTSIMRKLECNHIAALVKKALQSGLAK